MIAHIINIIFSISLGFLMGIWWAGAHIEYMEGEKEHGNK